jgi:prephenate dehydrogenase
MAIQITIIGLDQIGASIGLGLKGKAENMLRVGHDPNPLTAQAAEKLGAVDRISYNLPAAIEKADLIVMALPVDKVQETLKVIARIVRKDVVILDTSPFKGHVFAWAKEILPAERHFVGLVPVINPAYLSDSQSGVEAARPDLFKGGLFGLVVPPGVPEEAIKLTLDMARLLEAEHLFLEEIESDSHMAALNLLPQLVSSALLNMTVGKPGWEEGKKLAGRPYAQATAILNSMDGPQALAIAAINDRSDMLRVLDGLIEQLSSIRKLVADQDESRLADYLLAASDNRTRWLSERSQGNWANQELIRTMGEAPKPAGLGERLFGRAAKNKKK